MKSLITIFFLLFISQVSRSQNQTYLKEANGRPILGSVKSDVIGSPLLFKHFKVGVVQLKNGKSIKDVPLNFDLISNTPLFGKAGSPPLAFIDPVAAFSVQDTSSNGVTTVQYIFLDNDVTPSCYKVLSTGKLTLKKKLWKIVWEDKPYNSATITKNVLEKAAYYLQDPSSKKLTQLKPSKKNVLAVMADKSTEVQQYLKNNSVNFDEDQDLMALFTFYNGL